MYIIIGYPQYENIVHIIKDGNDNKKLVIIITVIYEITIHLIL